MKKLLGFALALALVYPSGPANAELFKNMKTTGSIDLQATSARNITDFSTNANDRLGTMATRVIAGFAWDVIDDAHAKITLRKNDRAWGTTGAAGQQAGGSEAIGNPGFGGVLSNTFVNEASIKIDKIFGVIDTTLGRQFWGDSGDLIAAWGPKNTYGLFVTAIDAAAVTASNDWMNFQGIAGKTTGSAIGATAATGAANDVDVRGIMADWKTLPVKVNTFIWNRVTHANGAFGKAGAAPVGGINDNLWVYGAKAKAEAKGAWINATIALNGGENRALTGNSANYIGKALLADVGYKADIANVGGITPWASFGWGTGRHDTASKENEDFQSIATDFRPGVIYGRFNGQGALSLGTAGGLTGFDGTAGVSNPGLTNRTIWGGGIKFNCARHPKGTLGISYWDFNYQHATQAGGTPAAAAGNRHIGSEFDLQYDWAQSDNVTLSGGWATFQPGGFIKESNRAPGATIGTDAVNMLFADIGFKF